LNLLKTKASSGDRDYVRGEIASALRRKIVVIPVRVGREDQLPPLPRAKELPPEIRDLVHYQKHDGHLGAVRSRCQRARQCDYGRATPSAPGERSSWSSCSMGLDWRDGRNRAGYRLGGRAPDELASVVVFRR